MDPIDTPTADVSRRSVLKKAAVGGAVVWAAPVITSLSSPAFAAGSEACDSSTCTEIKFGGVVFGHFICVPSPGFLGCPCLCAGLPTNSPCPSPGHPCSGVNYDCGAIAPGPCPTV